ncbi:glycine transporter YMC1 [Fusarium oxysporum f. sp. albedinis]|nr:glycine transporter YMC1 [Fusarium oxysporum f. sp. albedinis]
MPRGGASQLSKLSWAQKYTVNTIRSRRDTNAKPVRKIWYRRFRDNYPKLNTLILKAKEAARYEYKEAGIKETKQWFKQLDKVITRYRISALEI